MIGLIMLVVVVVFVMFAMNDFKLEGVLTNFKAWLGGVLAAVASWFVGVHEWLAGLL